jgi:hypothetical protein
MEKNNTDIDIAKQLILKVFFFLEKEYSYTPIPKHTEDPFFDKSLDVEYVNEVRRRNISVSYTKTNMNGETRHSFTLSIVRIPYTGYEDYFSLDNYLSSIGKNIQSGVMDIFSSERAESAITFLADAAKEYISSIIEGSVWLETYYPKKD